MNIKDKITQLNFYKNYILVKKYGKNIHDVDLTETIQEGVVDRLINARKLNIEYAVVLENIVPLTPSWDKYGDGTWNPKKNIITTEDIKTQNNDRIQEEKNIYDFLRGKSPMKSEFESMIKAESQNIREGKTRK